MKIMTAKIMKSKDVVTSEPPAGYKKVTGVYVEPQTEALVIVRDT